MLALKPVTEDRGRLMVQARAIPPVRFLAPRGFDTHRLACMLYSLVRVSRRADWRPSASVLRAQLSGEARGAPFIPRPPGRHGRAINARCSPARPADADQRPAHASGSLKSRRLPGRTRGLQSLPPQQFQALFDSLFKVLFIFPSRYLFAIGLPSVFSLR